MYLREVLISGLKNEGIDCTLHRKKSATRLLYAAQTQLLLKSNRLTLFFLLTTVSLS